MGKDSILSGIGILVGIAGLIAQINAPRCPTCGTKLVIINNYCIKCQVSYNQIKRT